MKKNNLFNSIILILLILFLLQTALTLYFSFLTFLDEIIPLIILLMYLTRGKIYFTDKSQLLIIIACVFLFVTGLISNFLYGFQTDILIILFDYYKIIKTFLIFVIMLEILKNRDFNRVILNFANFSTVYILTAFIFLFATYIFDLPMYDGVRFGLKEYKFIMPTAGLFGYTLMPPIMALVYSKSSYNKNFNNFIIIIGLILTASTGKGPQLVFVACLILISLYINSRIKFKYYHLLILTLLIAIIGQYQISTYLLNQSSPRYILIDTGFQIFRNYFPLGTGFATFGSEMSSRYYSKVYYLYGLDTIWGLSPDYDAFITDNFWPMIIGQFGIIGLILVIYIMYHMYKLIFKSRLLPLKMLPIVISSLLTYLVGSIGNPYIISENAIFYVVTLSLCLMGYKNKTENQKSESLSSNKDKSLIAPSLS